MIINLSGIQSCFHNNDRVCFKIIACTVSFKINACLYNGAAVIFR
jgi:hypothetical protein